MVVMADTIRTMSVLFNMGEEARMPARDSVKIQRRVESNVPFIFFYHSIPLYLTDTLRKYINTQIIIPVSLFCHPAVTVKIHLYFLSVAIR